MGVEILGGGRLPMALLPLSILERVEKMNIDEKAMMILEGMETYMQIDWNLEQWYLDAIKVGLKEIEKRELAEKKNLEQ